MIPTLFYALGMKNIIISIILTLTSFQFASAAVLEAKPVRDLLQTISSANFTFKEVGMVFGYNSIKSCLYVSDEMVVLKNYCVPKKNYPAKGYTIISPKFGTINFYQEQLSAEILKRDAEITVFPDLLRPHLSFSMASATLEQVNTVIKNTYYQYGPGCWTTNFSRYTEEPDSRCNTSEEVVGFDLWSAETQGLTSDIKNWNEVVSLLESKFKD